MGVKDASVIVDRIREDLELEETWYEKCRDAREAFSYIRGKLEEYGVVIMMSGVVGKNTHRALDVNEFRAFAMVDEWAPLIFINTADSNGAKLFSLLHEVAHIWLGEDDLADWVGKQTGFEICNHVIPEIISKYQDVLQYVQSCGLYKEQALQAWAP